MNFILRHKTSSPKGNDHSSESQQIIKVFSSKRFFQTNEGARVVTTFFPLYVYGDFSRHSRAANSAVLGPIWPNFGLVPDVMDVLVTCKIKKIPLKLKALEWSQNFTHYNPMGAICCHGNQSSDLMQPFPHPNDASDKIWLQ